MADEPGIVLHAGLLHLVFNPGEGSIRYLHAGDSEILRGIAAPVRDRAWATIMPVISDLVVRQQSDGFTLTFSARCKNHEVDFLWRGKIIGSPDNTLSFDFDGEALVDFDRNRIGFCILHAAELHGTNCIVEHVDGTIESGTFPERISARQPFTDIRAITHSPASGCHMEVRMEGDTYEMEDQRNWTDASYKTYCTPIRTGYPVRISKGARIKQRVTVCLHGNPNSLARQQIAPWATPHEVHLTVGDALPHTLAPLGASWNKPDISQTIREALRPLRLSHLRVDVCLGNRDYAELLRSAVAAALALNTALEISIFGGQNFAADLEALCEELTAIAPLPRIARWLVFHETQPCTKPEMVKIARSILNRNGLLAPIGGGAPNNFCELNGEPDIAEVADFPVYAANPQVHGFDEPSIIETLALHDVTVKNAIHLAQGRPPALSTITLTRRWRRGESGTNPDLPPNLQPLQSDARQASDFTAAWALGSLANASRHPLQSATYFEIMGANGLFDESGAAHPVARTFVQVAAFVQGNIFATTSSHPRQVEALALGHGSNRRLIMANLQKNKVTIRISGIWGERRALLGPYSVTSIDFT